MNLYRRLAGMFGRIGTGRQDSASPEVDFVQLEKAIKYKIKNQQIFSQALSHRSYLRVQGNHSTISYERLEFLGDSILNLVVAEYLFRQDTSAEEGDLTKVRSRLVNRKSLSVYSRQTQLEKFILISENVIKLGSRGT